MWYAVEQSCILSDIAQRLHHDNVMLWSCGVDLNVGSCAGSASKVAIICTATPAASQAHETRNTLEFGMRARRVRLCKKKFCCELIVDTRPLSY